MPNNPLAEVFGYPVNNFSKIATNHRTRRLCPFHNSSGLNCTKSSATDPIGVCSILHNQHAAITCPVRFREDLKIVADTSDFFFPGQKTVALTEARLKDKNGKSAGNIDIIIAALDDEGHVTDFGAVEVQAVYISGNVKNAFKEYMKNPKTKHSMDWPKKGYPRPDYLSSSRKRLAPQLIYKGGILHTWGKRMAVVVDESFFNQLPKLKETTKTKADLAWFVYGMRHDKKTNRYVLEQKKVYYTSFESALLTITNPEIGEVDTFMKYLQDRIKKNKITGTPVASPLPPDVEPLSNLLDNGDNE